MDALRQQLLRELESGIDVNAVNSPWYRRSSGSIDGYEKAEGDKSENIVMRGYASTNAPDLANEIIPANSWEKHLVRYKNNPIVCWMHDKKIPIGRVNSLHIDEKGLYLDEIVLIRELPIVKEFLGPLVENDVLRQLSVGFLSLEGHYDSPFWYHDENYLIENSLVSVACNPEAEAEIVRGFAFAKSAKVKTLDELVRSYHYGVIGEADRRKHFVMNAKNSLNMKEGAVDFTDIEATNESDDALLKPEEEAVSGLPKYHKEYERYGALTFAAFNPASKTFLFPFALKTENGYKYDFETVAVSMCRLLGAKGKANYSPEAFKAVLDRLCEIYTKMEKQVPTVDFGDGQVPINEVSIEFVPEIEYRKVTFREGENAIFAKKVLVKDAENMAKFINTLDRAQFDVLPFLKDFIAMVDIWGWVSNEEDAEKLAEILALLTAPEPEDVEDDEEDKPGAYSGEPYKEEDLSDSLKDFNEALLKFKT